MTIRFLRQPNGNTGHRCNPRPRRSSPVLRRCSIYPIWPDAITLIEKYNAAGGDITAQMFPRPIGLVIGLELTGNPLVFHPSYREIADLPLAERVAEIASLAKIAA